MRLSRTREFSCVLQLALLFWGVHIHDPDWFLRPKSVILSPTKNNMVVQESFMTRRSIPRSDLGDAIPHANLGSSLALSSGRIPPSLAHFALLSKT